MQMIRTDDRPISVDETRLPSCIGSEVYLTSDETNDYDLIRVRISSFSSTTVKHVACAHTRAHTHACTHTRTRARTYTHTHTHTHTHIQTHALAHTHTHVRAYTYTRTRILTRIYLFLAPVYHNFIVRRRVQCTRTP